ncbi:vitamin K epoxide reductase family protein [Streptomyces luteocolor]|uniref:vitamin K epoxide reductase family protein n=1 Tax=Streptomyces luteocolor TaxID=285500 RepID=UPI0008532F9B|nr:vitamin K epoxide reductase family protein [Streptomyces luteocolor]
MPASSVTARVPVGRALSLLMLGAGLLGTLASTVLTHDRIASLADPAFAPGCNISAVLSCGDVMDAWQSDVFGFPGMLLGVVGFAALAMLGLVLATGATVPVWLWWTVQAAVTAAFAFVVWLIVQCLYVIGALCPWCLLVWAVVLPLFWYVTLHTLRRGLLPAPRRLTEELCRYAWVGPVLMYGVLAMLIVTRFGDRLW